MQLFLIILCATICSYVGVAWVRGVAERKSILDIPNERSSHTRPTPRGGGLAIVVITGAGLLLAYAVQPFWPLPTLAGFLAGAVLVAVISWIDDLRNLPSTVRLLAHCGAALIAIVTLGAWPSIELPFVGVVPLGWFGNLLAFVWIVGMINIYNFMDGIDGLAGGQAVVAALGWLLWGWWHGDPAVLLLAALLAGSSLGFLGHNWPPARIFMGDVGSTFLGYSLAVLPLVAGQQDPGALLIGILFLWPFLFDAGLTILRRAKRRENVFASHRSHLYQRLTAGRHSHLQVTLGYMALASVGVLTALLWQARLPGASIAAVLLIPGLAWGLFYYTEHS